MDICKEDVKTLRTYKYKLVQRHPVWIEVYATIQFVNGKLYNVATEATRSYDEDEKWEINSILIKIIETLRYQEENNKFEWRKKDG